MIRELLTVVEVIYHLNKCNKLKPKPEKRKKVQIETTQHKEEKHELS